MRNSPASTLPPEATAITASPAISAGRNSAAASATAPPGSSTILQPREGQRHGPQRLVVADREARPAEALQDRKGDPPRLGRHDGIAERAAEARVAFDPPRGQRAGHVVEALGLDGADAQAGRVRLPAPARCPRSARRRRSRPAPRLRSRLPRRPAAAISSPVVPWPAITCGSSKGLIRVRPRSVASFAPMASRSSRRAVIEHHLGPEGAGVVDLHARRVGGHDDHRARCRGAAAASATPWA